MDSNETIRGLLAEAGRCLDAGRLAGSADAYRRALALSPEMPNSWYNLGRVLRLAGKPEEALAAYAEALERGVDGPEEVRVNRAVILSDDLARPDSAQTELEAALSLRPDYLPALLNLGNLHEDLGREAAAREVYREAREADPDNALVLARLVGVSALAGPDDPLLGDLARRAEAGSPSERADLGFAEGAALDRLGAFDSAFAAYRRANEASRMASGALYDRREQELFVDRMIESFPAPRKDSGATEEAPVFICGMFRSGSTLIELMLGRHPKISVGGELGLIPSIAASVRPYPEAVADMSAKALAEMRDTYLATIRSIFPDPKRVTDKRPDNFLHIGLIKAMFPAAKIVHTVREPLDNLLSLYFLHLDPEMAYALDLEDSAHWHRQYRRLMAHWRRLYASDIHDVSYDALVREPRTVIAGLLDFLGLEWDEACLSHEKADNPVRTASAGQVRKPLYQGSSGRWRNYERHLGPLLRALNHP